MNSGSNDFLAALMRNKPMIIFSIFVCCAIAASSYKFLQKNYKVTATISLETSYFQVPLVSGFLPEVSDTQELRAQRDALIHRALNHDFLTELNNQYHLIKPAIAQAPTIVSTYDLDLLSKRFEIIPSSPSSFVVSFIAHDPEQGYAVVQQFVNHLKTLMTDERRSHLLDLHDAIQDQLESLTFGSGGNESANPILSVRPDLVEHRAEKIQAEIETLKSTYSEKHPKIAELKRQLDQLSRFMTPHSEAVAAPARTDTFSEVHVDPASKDLFDDLLRKYRYLEVVMYMDQENKNQYLNYLSEPYVPRTPIWPKLPLLLSWGAAAGFLLGSALSLLKEMPKSRVRVLNNEISPDQTIHTPITPDLLGLETSGERAYGRVHSA